MSVGLLPLWIWLSAFLLCLIYLTLSQRDDVARHEQWKRGVLALMDDIERRAIERMNHRRQP